MVKENISWTDAEKQVLKLISENLKPFLKYCAIEWGYGLYLTTCSTVGWQGELKRRWMYTNPRRADQILTVGRAIGIKVKHASHWGMTTFEEMRFVEKAWEKYRKEIIAYKRVNHIITPKLLNQTQVLTELIKRDFKVWPQISQAYFIEAKHSAYTLRYRTSYRSLKEAKVAFRKVAVPGICKIMS